MVDELSPDCRGQIRFIDPSRRSCEPLTKRMLTSSLDGILSRTHMTQKPTDASALVIVKKQKTQVADVLHTPTAAVVEHTGRE